MLRLFEIVCAVYGIAVSGPLLFFEIITSHVMNYEIID